jgi:hypothetical protein
MINAIIINKKPHCPICEKRNYRVEDYKEIEHQNNKFTQIIARCSCQAEFKYCAAIKIDSEEYFVFNDEVEIKEEKGKLKNE